MAPTQHMREEYLAKIHLEEPLTLGLDHIKELLSVFVIYQPEKKKYDARHHITTSRRTQLKLYSEYSSLIYHAYLN